MILRLGRPYGLPFVGRERTGAVVAYGDGDAGLKGLCAGEVGPGVG